ncbi:MAG: hypothetical protein ACTHJ8_10675 [Mucilaginibacter sp.]
MNKTAIRLISVIVVLAFIIIAGKLLYRVLCISCTIPPIKTYNYSGSMDQFEYKIRHFAATAAVNLEVSRRDSSDNRSARDLIIRVKNSSSIVRYQMVLYDFNGATKLDLEEVYDETHKTGGNDIKNVKTKELYVDFKNKFLPALEKNQDIVLKNSL